MRLAGKGLRLRQAVDWYLNGIQCCLAASDRGERSLGVVGMVVGVDGAFRRGSERCG